MSGISYSFDAAGVYEIHVLGTVDALTSDCLSGMKPVRFERSEESGETVTVLAGWLRDQAALNGALNTLYNRQYALKLVRRLDDSTAGST